MTINLTLFIQMIHFYIAYLIISKVLLKRAVSIIIQDDDTERGLLFIINRKREEVMGKINLKASLWSDAIIRFMHEKPKVSKVKKTASLETFAPEHDSGDFALKFKKQIEPIITDGLKSVK